MKGKRVTSLERVLQRDEQNEMLKVNGSTNACSLRRGYLITGLDTE